MMAQTPLEKIIIQKIKDEGPMNLATYMGLCLGHPTHGYYMTRDPFGAKGDFTTAPEISQIFGELIGAWVADTWVKMGAPETFILLECGPGRGTLMADALRATKMVQGFHDAMALYLLEMSPVLKEAQSKNLNAYDATWIDALSDLPKDVPVIVVGNEFLDALPVRQLVWSASAWHEKMLDLSTNDTLSLEQFVADKEVINCLTPFLIPPKEGECVEVSLEQKAFLGELMNIVINQKAVALFIDYGFAHNMAGDTLQAVKDHAYCNILETPGEADITAHVNFAEVSKVGLEKNLIVHGSVTQGDFLTRLGVSIRAGLLGENKDDLTRRDIAASVQRLVGTDTKNNEMGQLFKAIAFSSDPEIELAGFA